MPELIALPDVRIVPTAERYVEGFNARSASSGWARGAEGRKSRARKIDGVYDDDVIMARFLDR